jgi:hypothetical protein
MTAAPAPAGQPADRARSVRVFFACWLVYTVFWAPYIVREHYPAVTLAEQGSLDVERYLGWSDDLFRGPRGGAYINNNPGASLTGAIPLVLFRPLLARVDEWNQKLPRKSRKIDSDEWYWLAARDGRIFYFLLVGFITVAFVMAPLTAAVIGWLCSKLIEAGVPGRFAAGAALLTGLGTPLLFRTGHLNHNLLVADAGFAALLLLWDPKERSLHPARAFCAGLLGGYSLLCDYSGVVVIITAGAYVWLRARDRGQRLRTLLAFAGGVIPGAAALLVYQGWAFGSFYLPSQQYMPPTAPTSQGYRGLSWPSPALAWALFVDPRFGLFAYCPALILALFAPFAKRGKYRLPRRETWLLLGYFGIFVVFCSANQYSWLQPLTGFRYLVPVVPGLALLAIQTAQSLPRWARIAISWGAVLQSFLIAAVHENDLRLSLATLWQRRFEMLWMLRLSWAGLSQGWLAVTELIAAALLAVALFQIAIALRMDDRMVPGPGTRTTNLE